MESIRRPLGLSNHISSQFREVQTEKIWLLNNLERIDIYNKLIVMINCISASWSLVTAHERPLKVAYYSKLTEQMFSDDGACRLWTLLTLLSVPQETCWAVVKGLGYLALCDVTKGPRGWNMWKVKRF